MKKGTAILLVILVCLLSASCGNSTEDTGSSQLPIGASGTEAIGTSKVPDTGKAMIAKAKELVQPYADNEGYLEYDPEKLNKSSMLVYNYAQQLKQNGIILDCSYCEDSFTVAFFLDDSNVTLYVPKIRDYYAYGTEDFSVSSVDSLSLTDDVVITSLDALSRFPVAGSQESAKIITASAKQYTLHQDMNRANLKSLSDVKNWMASLGKNGTRVVLWRGHGTVYKERTGKKTACWMVPVAVNNSDDASYRDNEYSILDDGTNYAVSESFWQKYCSDVDGALFYCGSCHSGYDACSAAKVFFAKGFDVFAGAEDAIFTLYSDKLMGRTVEYLSGNIDGIMYDFDTSFEMAKAELGQSDLGNIGIRMLYKSQNEPFFLVPYREAYAELLRQKESEYQYEHRFQLIYIDEDNVPELAYFQGASHMQGVELYTFYQNKVVSLGRKGAYGMIPYAEKKNRIFGYTGINANEELEAQYTYMIRDGQLVQAPDHKGYESISASWSKAIDINEENIRALLDGTQ